MRPKYLLYLVVLNFAWASSLSMYQYLETYLRPPGIVTFRFGIAALVLALFWPLYKGPAPNGKQLILTFVMGITVFFIGHRLQVSGAQLAGAGNSSILMGVEPLITAVGAAIVLREQVTKRRWAGAALGIIGVGVLNEAWRDDFKLAGLIPSLIFISSFICETIYSVMGKPIIEKCDLMKTSTIAMLAGTFLNVAVNGGETFVMAREVPPAGWAMLLFMALVCTAIGYTAWFLIIRETDVNLAVLTIFIQPVAGVIIAALWLRETLHMAQLWGCLVILSGLVLGLWPQRRPVVDKG